jgi:hypothetical protein
VIRMKNKNLFAITLLVAVLVSSAFVSLAAADDNVSDVTIPPDQTGSPDRSPDDSVDNSTGTQNDGVLYAMDDNRTATEDTQAPEEANLTATQTSTSDNTLLFVAVATVLAIVVGGVIGVFFYRRKA